eukprot:SM000007S20887  [mRNA]  locus=s7:730704:733698:- [translate_table: standard]
MEPCGAPSCPKRLSSLLQATGPLAAAATSPPPPTPAVDAAGVQLLAVKRRVDPLDGFKYYRGGYDPRSKHYWGSLAFLGIWGYAAGALWLLLGALAVLGLLCCCCCRRSPKEWRQGKEPESAPYIWALLLTILLTAVALAGIAILSIGTRGLRHRANDVTDEIVRAADNTTANIRTISAVLQNTSSLAELLESGSGSDVNSTARDLNSQADKLEREVRRNKDNIKSILNGIEIALIVIAAVDLVVVLAALMAALCGITTLLPILAVLGWLLTALAWVLFGVCLMLSALIGDTCEAMDEYSANPTYNTTLDALLPCVDLQTSRSALLRSKASVKSYVATINGYVAQENAVLSLQGSTLLPTVCDPFGPAPTYADVACSNNMFPIGNYSQILAPLVCNSTNQTQCTLAGTPVPSTLYSQFLVYSAAAEELLATLPLMEDLANCRFVTDSFSLLVDHDCSSAKRAARLVWVGFLVMSAAMVGLVVAWFWTARCLKRRQRLRPVSPSSPSNSRFLRQLGGEHIVQSSGLAKPVSTPLPK